jgi:hypothetical protein
MDTASNDDDLSHLSLATHLQSAREVQVIWEAVQRQHAV